MLIADKLTPRSIVWLLDLGAFDMNHSQARTGIGYVVSIRRIPILEVKIDDIGHVPDGPDAFRPYISGVDGDDRLFEGTILVPSS